MEVQLKKGILDIVVLSTLINKDSYGYKIIQDISGIVEISESTLYPILRRLETSNCLTTYNVEHNGRLRKYYKITREGIGKIKTFIDEWQEIKNIYEFIVNKSRSNL
ncbi:MAG: PadR family transcriptional regulator [Christensenellales bacterium]|jgi:PadR family transcriptional regulator PadR